MEDRPAAWDAYEQAVMEGQSEVPVPPEDYEMSPVFQEWVLERMRKDVMAQVSGAGLDRMALMVDSDASEGSEDEADS